MRLPDANTANESSCFKKKYHPCLCSFIRLRARYFAMTSCKDLLVITKKIEMTFHSIMESISNLGKIARTSAKSENPNEAEVISFKKSFEINFLLRRSAK